MSFTNRSRTTTPRRRSGNRRGVALVFTLIFVIAMAALAMSSIFMASNANLLAKSYDRERDLKFAAEAALAIGKSRVNADPNVLTIHPDSFDKTILSQHILTGADGKPLTGIKVNIYVGNTGSTSGQFGRFSSIVAEARDQRGNGFIRRLELTQESFAKFAYWSSSESNMSATIFFNNGDALWGPVWSNDTISIGSGGASFHDEVGTVFFVSGANYGTFSKGYKQYQKPIALPSTTALNNLVTIATSSGWNQNSNVGGSINATSVLERLEFIAVDLNNPALNDSTDLNEGFFMVFNAVNAAAARGDYPAGAPPDIDDVKWCGDWHVTRQNPAQASSRISQFYPASVHNTSWFKAQMKQGLIDGGTSSGTAETLAEAEQEASLSTIMQHNGARCYLPGDPHLAAVERFLPSNDPATGSDWAAASREKGGNDTTFTPSGVNGSWRISPQAPSAGLLNRRPTQMAQYMWPIDRQFNNNAKGVVTFDGNVALSGTLNGRLTVYAKGSIILVDDLRYANDPVKGVCRDILGLIADNDVVIADNATNTPDYITSTARVNNDDTKDVDIHAVLMSLGTSFRAENHDSGPTAVNNCDATINGRGCIYLSGGIIQQSRGPVGRSDGTGFAKRYSYDRCAVVNPPPYFPTTGRFQDNRYLELDPAGFDHKKYFKSLTPDP